MHSRWHKPKEARLILQSGIYIFIFTNISEGRAFHLQGLTYNEEVYARTSQLEIKNSVQYDTIIITRENLNEKKVNVKSMRNKNKNR